MKYKRNKKIMKNQRFFKPLLDRDFTKSHITNLTKFWVRKYFYKKYKNISNQRYKKSRFLRNKYKWYKDTDRDGYINWKDCFPFDNKRDSNDPQRDKAVADMERARAKEKAKQPYQGPQKPGYGFTPTGGSAPLVQGPLRPGEERTTSGFVRTGGSSGGGLTSTEQLSGGSSGGGLTSTEQLSQSEVIKIDSPSKELKLINSNNFNPNLKDYSSYYTNPFVQKYISKPDEQGVSTIMRTKELPQVIKTNKGEVFFKYKDGKRILVEQGQSFLPIDKAKDEVRSSKELYSSIIGVTPDFLEIIKDKGDPFSKIKDVDKRENLIIDKENELESINKQIKQKDISFRTNWDNSDEWKDNKDKVSKYNQEVEEYKELVNSYNNTLKDYFKIIPEKPIFDKKGNITGYESEYFQQSMDKSNYELAIKKEEAKSIVKERKGYSIIKNKDGVNINILADEYVKYDSKGEGRLATKEEIELYNKYNPQALYEKSSTYGIKDPTKETSQWTKFKGYVQHKPNLVPLTYDQAGRLIDVGSVIGGTITGHPGLVVTGTTSIIRKEGGFNWVDPLLRKKEIKDTELLSGRKLTNTEKDYIKEYGQPNKELQKEIDNKLKNSKFDLKVFGVYASDYGIDFWKDATNHPYKYYALAKAMQWGSSGIGTGINIGGSLISPRVGLFAETATKWGVNKLITHGIPIYSGMKEYKQSKRYDKALGAFTGEYLDFSMIDYGIKKFGGFQQVRNAMDESIKKGTVDEFYNTMKSGGYWNTRTESERELITKWYNLYKGDSVKNSFKNIIKQSSNFKEYTPNEISNLKHIVKDTAQQEIIKEAIIKNNLYLTGSSATGKVSAKDIDLVQMRPKWQEFPIKIGNKIILMKTPFYGITPTKPELTKFFAQIAEKGVKVKGAEIPKEDITKVNLKELDRKKRIEYVEKSDISSKGEDIIKRERMTKWDLFQHSIKSRIKRNLGISLKEYSKPIRDIDQVIKDSKYKEAIKEVLVKQNLITMGKRSENLFTKEITDTKDFDTMTKKGDAYEDAQKALSIFKKYGFNNVEIRKIEYKDKDTGKIMHSRQSYRIVEKGQPKIKPESIIEITPMKYNIQLETIKVPTKDGNIEIIPLEEAIRAKFFSISKMDKSRFIKDANSIERLTDGKIKARDLIEWRRGMPIVKTGEIAKAKWGEVLDQQKASKRYQESLQTKRKAESEINDKKAEIHTKEWMEAFPYYKGVSYDKDLGIKRVGKQEQIIRKAFGAFADTRAEKDIPDLMRMMGYKTNAENKLIKFKNELIKNNKLFLDNQGNIIKTNKLSKIELNKLNNLNKEITNSNRIINNKKRFLSEKEFSKLENEYNRKLYEQYKLNNKGYSIPYKNEYGKTKYQEYSTYKGYGSYKPYNYNISQYKPYTPYKPNIYKSYLPYTPYAPYVPYIPYTPIITKEPPTKKPIIFWKSKPKKKKRYTSKKGKYNLMRAQDPFMRITGKAKYSTDINKMMRRRYGTLYQ